ncbi:unnamed protein product, partial [Rotaria sp. Silwood2]
MKASTSTLIPSVQQREPHSTKTKKPRKKCHGNRKLQRFRKKCYKRGLTKEQTQHLIHEYNHNNKPNEHVNNNVKQDQLTTIEKMEVSTDFTHTSNAYETTTTTTTISHKRKQSQRTPSSSQRSDSRSTVKKMKRNKSSQIDMTPLKPTYKLPVYLKQHAKLLFRNLRVLLKHTLRKKCERQFLHHRLQLLDQQGRLGLRQNLWQSYLSLGSDKEVWPNSVIKMAKTNEHTVCEQFVKQHLHEMKHKFDYFTNELKLQWESYPRTLLSLQSSLDQHLQQFVELQQKYLATKMHYQLHRYEDMIAEIDLIQSLSSFPLTTDHQTTIDHLIHLQEKQVVIYEDLQKLEARIAIDILPRSFDELEWFIACDDYIPFIKDNIAVEFQQNQYKIIQEAKRTWLNSYMVAYESQITQIEHEYEMELHQFELTNSSQSYLNNANITLFQSFLNYINHRI